MSEKQGKIKNNFAIKCDDTIDEIYSVNHEGKVLMDLSLLSQYIIIYQLVDLFLSFIYGWKINYS